jgi:chromosome segregation ATPase
MPIFRSANTDHNAIDPCETFGLSSTSSSNSSQSAGNFAFSHEDILRIHKTHTQDLEERDNEIRKMQMVMQELKDLHRDAMEEKDNAIFHLEHELSSTKRHISNQKIVCAEFENIKSTLTLKQLELNARKQDVLDMNHHLRLVHSELKQTRKDLQESTVKIDEQREQIEDRDAEISKLQKKLKLGRAASSAVFGLMTLGAALSADDSRASF